MSQALLAMMGAGSASAPTYVDDVFSTYTYTGNGSTQTITNGIDLAGKGGLVWIKNRNGVADQFLQDTVRGVNNYLNSNNTNLASTLSGINFAFNSDGFSQNNAYAGFNANSGGQTYVSWTFRKAAKFFDVVTYTGDGATGRQIAHSLGVVPGMVIVKCTSLTTDWVVYHRSNGATKFNYLNTTDAAASDGGAFWNSTEPSGTVFTVGNAAVNQTGQTYVAYLFAHDTSADGIIQCGSFTTDGSGNATVTLGWEPQYMITKTTNTTNQWIMVDSMRGFTVPAGTTNALYANLTNAEGALGATYYPTATGFFTTGQFGASNTIAYLAIRRPNKPPTVGTQVYNAKINIGNSTAKSITGVGFKPDMCFSAARATSGQCRDWMDSLRGPLKALYSDRPDAEVTETASLTAFGVNGISVGVDSTQGYWNNNYGVGAHDFSQHFFRRAPGVFDIVCYTGTGSAHTESHNLGVAPELMIVKSRSGVAHWAVQVAPLGATKTLFLNLTSAEDVGSYPWNDTSPTATAFTLGASTVTNLNTATYVAYLFATKAGISKVGSYTGNGTTNAINCGFTTGARFVMIKRTDSTGDWYVWDTVRGIVAGNDPYLVLNSTTAEVTSTDYIDPSTAGFELSSTAPAAINASGGTFIFLAFA